MTLPPNLIFDLGGVLYGIDFQRSVSALSDLAGGNKEVEVMRSLKEDRFWNDFETGHMDSAGFREVVRERFQISSVSDDEIDAAWNALLMGVLPGRVEQIAQLSRNHRMVLLSNTNPIHYNYLRDQCFGLFGHLEKQFLSFEMGLRKPDPGIFQQLLDTMDWNAKECLFLDDSELNVNAAKSVDIQAVIFKKNQKTFLFKE